MGLGSRFRNYLILSHLSPFLVTKKNKLKLNSVGLLDFANLQKAWQNIHFVQETRNWMFCLPNICTGSLTAPGSLGRVRLSRAKPEFSQRFSQNTDCAENGKLFWKTFQKLSKCYMLPLPNQS